MHRKGLRIDGLLESNVGMRRPRGAGDSGEQRLEAAIHGEGMEVDGYVPNTYYKLSPEAAELLGPAFSWLCPSAHRLGRNGA